MAVNWNDYDTFSEVIKKYLPAQGEGENKATQLVTAVNKLVYKWYNDGDVYDTTGTLKGWANDLSSYANWIYKYNPRYRSLLDEIFDCREDGDYEDLLWKLSEQVFDADYLEKLASEERVGSIYDCDGPYEYKEYDEEEDDDYYEEDDYDEDEDIESAVDINAAEEPKNEALEDAMSNLKDDFDFIMQGLEKLERTSAEDSRIALEIAEGFSASIQDTIAAISERF